MHPIKILKIFINLLVLINMAYTAPSSQSASSSSVAVLSKQNTVAASLVQQRATILTTNTFSSSPSSHSTSLPSSMRLRKRHRKRHSIWFDYNNMNENSSMLEWSNPCGGFFDPNAKHGKRPSKKEQKKIYNTLRRTAINDYNMLNVSHQQDIDISNMEIWWLHNYNYKFLPKLKINSSIALIRWYRNMQTYVASFAYLRRVQLKWDQSKSQRESKISQELKELFKSSRNMLCELETAVNKTYPYKARKANKQIPQVTRQQMNKRLKLRTKATDNNPNVLQEADSIDLKFVKFHYFEYLKNMWKILRRYTKRKGQAALDKTRENIKMFNEVEKMLNRNSNMESQSSFASFSTSNSATNNRQRRKKNSKIRHKLV